MRRPIIAKTVKLSNRLVVETAIASKKGKRPIVEQVEDWATIEKIAEENPDLPFVFIKAILVSKRKAEQGELEKYIFD